MEKIYNILIIVLPTIITGIFTFFITKYTYTNNRPIDKLEIAYNRVYYPLYRLIKSNNNIDSVIDKSEQYFEKYKKYIDRSTIRSYDVLVTCDTKVKKKSAYEKFKDNIYNKNSYLRRRLGYLEPSFFQIYKYETTLNRFLFRVLIEFLFMYISIALITLKIKILQNYAALTLLFILIFFILDAVCFLIKSVYYKIRK